MGALAPVGAEDLVARELSAAGLAATPPPVPDSLGEGLPRAVVYQVGGRRLNPVVDAVSMSVDVYAESWARAMEAACLAAGAIAALPLSGATGTHWREATLDVLPYANPDPLRGDLARCTLAATVCVRAIETD